MLKCTGQLGATADLHNPPPDAHWPQADLRNSPRDLHNPPTDLRNDQRDPRSAVAALQPIHFGVSQMCCKQCPPPPLIPHYPPPLLMYTTTALPMLHLPRGAAHSRGAALSLLHASACCAIQASADWQKAEASSKLCRNVYLALAKWAPKQAPSPSNINQSTSHHCCASQMCYGCCCGMHNSAARKGKVEYKLSIQNILTSRQLGMLLRHTHG